MKKSIIYFDNAATSYPKPQCVIKETVKAFSEFGGNPGRSGHTLSLNAARQIYQCREEICTLLNYNIPENVVFTQNTTHALNVAIQGLAVNDSHILISNLEHNSVIRPVYALSENPYRNISYSFFDATSGNDNDIIDSFKKALRPITKLAVVTACSNICGKIIPIDKISRICKERGIFLVVDAAQALGEIEIDASRLNADVICCAGHKGLCGPTGTGFAVFNKGVKPNCIVQGGNGILSEMPEMTGEMPELLEVGTLNTIGICGLKAGIRYLRHEGIECISERTRQLQKYITDGLLSMGANVYGNYSVKSPIILFNIPGENPAEISSYLDENNICTRSGLHCAPLAHKALATGENGAVRVSLGYANTATECSSFLNAMYNFVKRKNTP